MASFVSDPYTLYSFRRARGFVPCLETEPPTPRAFQRHLALLALLTPPVVIHSQRAYCQGYECHCYPCGHAATPLSE